MSSNERKKYHWLWKNQFFKETPLHGYAFIDNSKRLVEVIFWYFALLCFIGLTVGYIGAAFGQFLSKPTRTDAKIASSARQGSINNLTIAISMPHFEFYTNSRLVNLFSRVMPFDHHFLCQSYYSEDLVREALDMGIGYAYKDIAYKWANIYQMSSNGYSPTSLYNMREDLFSVKPDSKPWLQRIKDMKQSYLKNSSKFRKLPSWNKQRHTEFFDLWSVMQDARAENWLSFSSGILLLAAASDPSVLTGESFQWFWDVERQWSEWPTPEADQNLLNYILNYNGLTVAQLSTAVDAEIGNILPIVSNVDAKFFFRGITDSKHYQTVYLQAVLPGDVKQLELTFYSKRLSYFLLFVELLLALFQKTTCGNIMFDCHDYLQAAQPIWYVAPSAQWTHKCENETAQQSGQISRKNAEFVRRVLSPTIEMYRKNAAVQIITEGGATRLSPFSYHELMFRPSGQFRSQTKDCFEMPLASCVDLCFVESTLEACDCVPPALKYIAKANEQLCLNPCQQVQLEKCTNKCEENLARPCDLTLYTLTQRNEQKISMMPKISGQNKELLFEKPLLELSLNIEQVLNYPEFGERYEFTVGGFISQLGGLMDFWLGFNIISLIHAIVYFTKKIIITALGRNNKVGELGQNENKTSDREKRMIKKIKALRSEFSRELNSMHQGAQNIKKDKETEKKDRFKWLSRNSFFEQTPIAGYLFILHAQKKKEMIFWYLVLFVLSCITFYNVYDATMHYVSKPTIIKLKLIASPVNTTFGNFSLEMTIPNFELSGERQLFAKPKDLRYLCGTKFNDLWLEIWSRQIANTSVQLASYFLDRIRKKQNQTIKSSLETRTGTKSVWEMFEFLSITYANYSADYRTWIRGGYESFVGEYGTRIVYKLIEIWDIMNDAGNEDWALLRPALLLLEALNQPSQLENILKNGARGEDILKAEDLTMEELYEGIGSELQNVLPIVVLHDQGQSPVFYVGEHTAAQSQTLKFQIIIPQNVAQFSMHIFSKRLAYFLLYAQIQLDVVDYIDCGPTLVYCDGSVSQNQWMIACLPEDNNQYTFYNQMRQRVVKLLVDPIIGVYRSLSNFQIHTQAGSLQMDAFTINQISLRPMARFRSETHRCYPYTFSTCVDMCLLEESIAQCNCHPSYLSDTVWDQGSQICIEPCTDWSHKAACSDACELKRSRPCDSTLYAVERANVEPIIHSSDSTLLNRAGRKLFETEYLRADFKIQEMLTHPQVVEVYAMTLGDFLAQLGGLMDLFIGVNLIGLLHLIVYITKQIIHSAKGTGYRREKSDNVMKTIHQQIQEMEEEIGNKLGMVAV